MKNISKFFLFFLYLFVIFVNYYWIFHYRTSVFDEERTSIIERIKLNNEIIEKKLIDSIKKSMDEKFQVNTNEKIKIINNNKEEIIKEIEKLSIDEGNLDDINKKINGMKEINFKKCSEDTENIVTNSVIDKKDKDLLDIVSFGYYNIKKDLIRNNCDCFNLNKSMIVFSDYRTGSTNLINMLNGCEDLNKNYELFRVLKYKSFKSFNLYITKDIKNGRSWKIQNDYFYQKYKYLQLFLEKNRKDLDVNLLILERENKLNQFISYKIATSPTNLKNPNTRFHNQTKEDKLNIIYNFDKDEYVNWVIYQNQYYNDVINLLFEYSDDYCVNYITYEEYTRNWEICEKKAICKSKIIG